MARGRWACSRAACARPKPRSKRRWPSSRWPSARRRGARMRRRPSPWIASRLRLDDFAIDTSQCPSFRASFARMSSAGYRLANLLTLPGSPHRFIAAQLRQPSGRFGRWVMTRVLNNRNSELITSTVDALELRRDQSFLDLGFGGGLALSLAAARTDAPLWGVDFSADVVLAGVD